MATGGGTGTPAGAVAAEVTLCNLALGRIGASAITALGEGSDESAQCDLYYEPTRDALLRSHPWRFALKWVDLVVDVRDDYGTATDAAATTLEDTDKSWDTDEYDGYWVRITGGTGSGQIRPIASNTADTLTVTGAWATTPDETSTYNIWENYPPHPWDYQYDLPSDFMRFVRTDPKHEKFEIAGTMFKSDEDGVVIQYVWAITDADLFDPLFVQLMVAELAMKFCMPLRKDKVLHQELMLELAEVRSRARVVNLQEALTEPEDKTWWESRR